MPNRISNRELADRENRIGRLVAIQKRLEVLEEIAHANYSPELLALIQECYALLITAKREEIARLRARKEGLTEEEISAEIAKLFSHGANPK